jgi:glycosyltransferase involved in cell wall biosynthesis
MTDSNCPTPKVSVLMVTYNHVNFIEQAIESVLMQETDFKYELVIGEDCSTDRTREIVEIYAEKYPDRIKVLLHPKNIGMQRNFIEVWKACTGEYIALLEGDDYWTDPEKLQKQVDFLDGNPDFSICFHKVKILENNELKDDYITTVPSNVSTIEDLAKGNYIHTPSCIFRNRGTEILGENFLRSPIGDYYIHMMNALYGKIYYTDEPMAVYRVHSDSYWSQVSQSERIIKTLEALRCIFLDLKNPAPEVNLKILNLHFRYLVDLYTNHSVVQDVDFSKIRLDHFSTTKTSNIYLLMLFDELKKALVINRKLSLQINEYSSIKFLSEKLLNEMQKKLFRRLKNSE